MDKFTLSIEHEWNSTSVRFICCKFDCQLSVGQNMSAMMLYVIVPISFILRHACHC